MSLKIRIQATNFLFYLIGVGIRALLFVFATSCAFLIQRRPIQGILGLVICLFLMWLDAQETNNPKDWLRAKKHMVE